MNYLHIVVVGRLVCKHNLLLLNVITLEITFNFLPTIVHMTLSKVNKQWMTPLAARLGRTCGHIRSQQQLLPPPAWLNYTFHITGSRSAHAGINCASFQHDSAHQACLLSPLHSFCPPALVHMWLEYCPSLVHAYCSYFTSNMHASASATVQTKIKCNYFTILFIL